MRKVIFWIHLAAGVTAGLIVVLMSVTGVLLAYEKQIRAWADRGSLQVSGGAPLPVEELLRRVNAKPGTPVVIRHGDSEPVELALGGKEGNVFFDRATAARLGRNSTRTAETLAAITSWHRRLGVDNPGSRNTARLITGVCNLAFLCMILTGAYLWLPRKWSAQHLRPIVWFRSGLAGKARDFNWHNAIGVWCAIPLAIVVLGAVPISFVWASDLVYTIMGVAPPKPAPPPPPAPAHAAPTVAALDGLDALIDRARAVRSDWRTIGFRVPASAEAPITFAIDWGTGGEPQKKGNLTLHRGPDAAGKEKWEAFEHFDAGRRLRLWLRFLHTGEALGLAGQTIAAIASAGAVVLGWTGIALALRRWSAWRTRRVNAAAPVGS